MRIWHDPIGPCTVVRMDTNLRVNGDSVRGDATLDLGKLDDDSEITVTISHNGMAQQAICLPLEELREAINEF